ncbi:hypothetical protein UlMin_028311 [Ulmus minor]
MFRFCYQSLPLPIQSCRNIGIPVTHLIFLQIPLIFPKSLSSKIDFPPKGTYLDCSFIASYLRKSWGLSPENALFVSKKIKIKSLGRSEANLSLFREYGFTDTKISRVVKSRPSLLLADFEKTILPKFEFFNSIGISGSDLAEAIARNPMLLELSLENTIVPFYDVVKRVLPVQKVVKFFGHATWRFSSKEARSNFGPNISTLKELGVPNSSIVYLLVSSHVSITLQQDTEEFKENAAKVIGMGFNPSLLTFGKALQVISTLKNSKWEEKMELYRECGWTDDEILLAFRKCPLNMFLVEKNVVPKMSFFVNKMGLQPSDVARTPDVLQRSLENWIIPRCCVIRALLLKGLIKKEFSLSSILSCNKEKFLDKFVLKYHQEIPQLSSIFEGKMSLEELGLGFDDTGRKKQL